MAGTRMVGRYGGGRSRGLAAGGPERMDRRSAHERALGGVGDLGPSLSIRIERRATADELRQRRLSGRPQPSYPGPAKGRALAGSLTLLRGHAADQVIRIERAQLRQDAETHDVSVTVLNSPNRIHLESDVPHHDGPAAIDFLRRAD